MIRRTWTERAAMGKVAGLAVALLALAAGCGDPLADKLESSGKQPYSDDDPPLIDPANTIPPSESTATPNTVAPTTAPVDPAAEAATQAFVDQANQVCADAIASAAPMPTVESEIPAYLEQMVTVSETILAQLRQLPPPPADEAIVAHLLSEHEAVVGALRAAVDEGRMDSAEEMRAVTDEIKPRSDALDAAFRDYGLTSCG